MNRRCLGQRVWLDGRISPRLSRRMKHQGVPIQLIIIHVMTLQLLCGVGGRVRSTSKFGSIAVSLDGEEINAKGAPPCDHHLTANLFF
jgi:hypothetical protein